MNERITNIDPTCELAERRQAAADLGGALRDYLDAVCANEADVDVLARLASATRSLTAELTSTARPVLTVSSLDDRDAGISLFSPVRGKANPIAPPLHVVRDTETTMSARAILGRRHEGPPGCVHGGISALILDEMLGICAIGCGSGGMTVKLDLNYRAPVPLGEPLLVRSWLVAVDGRKTSVSGSIATEVDPDRVLVEASGMWVAPREETIDRLFGGLVRADGTPLHGRFGWADHV